MMSDDEAESFLDETWRDYKEALLEAGLDESSAQENIDRNRAALYEGDRLNELQFVLSVVSEGRKVGGVWIAALPGRPASYFIYDIVIEPDWRGRGLGRAAMRAIEEWVQDRGGQEIGLNVFGHNQRARNLYESLEYETVNVGMRKRLHP